MGVDAYRSALAGFLARYDEYLPAVAPDGGEAAMPGDEPYAYYGTERSVAPHRRNQVTVGSLYYDREPYVTRAVEATAEFLRRTL
jgi:uncharacterized protein